MLAGEPEKIPIFCVARNAVTAKGTIFMGRTKEALQNKRDLVILD